MRKRKDISIRSSAAEYLTFVAPTGDSQESIEMRYEDENIWLTQKMMAQLYDVAVQGIGQHIKRIYNDSELEEGATIKKFFIVQTEGGRQVTQEVTHYNLQMIIAVGFKVNNERAVQFRKWANNIVKDYTIKGWSMQEEHPNDISILSAPAEKHGAESSKAVRHSGQGSKMQIRNSTIDFLVFTKDAHEDSIEVRVQDNDVWLTQKAIARLFDVDRSVVAKHLKNVFDSGELSEEATCAKFAQVADNGKTYRYKFYSLSAIIAVGYRTNSDRATQFRQWATKILDTFSKRGYVLDKDRLINGQIFDESYFDHLISEIQEIRASERRFYQKITDIYATAVDYSLDSQITKDFFATVQNKMHYAVHGKTAAEMIVARADHTKTNMGLTSWRNAPEGKIVRSDVSIAKNYLSVNEMQELNEIVTMYLDYATRQARRHIPMTMADWAGKLDAFLKFNDAEILQDKGRVTAAIAKAFAESEFEKYRVIQDRLYQSDFDRLVMEASLQESSDK